MFFIGAACLAIFGYSWVISPIFVHFAKICKFWAKFNQFLPNLSQFVNTLNGFHPKVQRSEKNIKCTTVVPCAGLDIGIDLYLCVENLYLHLEVHI